MLSLGPRRRAIARAHLAAFAAAALLAGCANINELGDATLYDATSDARSERSDGAGRWKLSLGPGADNIDTRLLYRAAIHAKAGGYSHVQVYGYGPLGDGGGVEIRTQGTSDSAPPPQCFTSPENRGRCATWNAEEVIATRGRTLGRSPALIETDLADAREAEPTP
ncbi:MAG: hypothetical protein V4574_04620 [Pseudomonadota bacterium]